MKSAKPAIPIPTAELSRFTDGAMNPILASKWRPRTAMQGGSTTDSSKIRESKITAGSGYEEENFGSTALTVGNEKRLPDEDGNRIVHAVTRGIQIALYLAEMFRKQTNLDQLLRKNQIAGQLTTAEVTEFQQKNATEAAITVFVAAYYTFTMLSRYKTEEVASVPMELPLAPEVSLIDPPQALDCFTFYFSRVLSFENKGEKLVRTGAGAVKMSMLYLQRVMDEIKLKLSSNALFYTESFVNASYKLEDEDFTVNGFEIELGGPQVKVSVNPVRFDEIVGNRAAKHNALRGVQRLSLYDFKVQQNPYLIAFGEVPIISMGKGMAGTGKTIMAGAEYTELSRVGDNLGFVPLYWELPKDIGSEFQSKSAKQMTEWTRRFYDLSRIVYGVIDDAEGVIKSIEGNNSAESTEGIVSVFLTFTEGAAASRRLNWILKVLTNLPEKIYQPVMSRIQDKYDIEGAITVEDFLDQDWLWRQKIAKQDSTFDDMKNPDKYVYMSTQGHMVNLSQLYAKEPVEPREGTLRNIFEEVRKTFHEDEHMFYAQVYAKVKKAFPTSFSSRDVRNIQVAINNRRTDFDVDPQWLEKRDIFTDKPFDEKVKMLLDRQKEALNGLSMKTCRLQETVRYLNVLLSIPENARKREVNELRDGIVKQFDAHKEAQQLLMSTGRVKTSAEAAAA